MSVEVFLRGNKMIVRASWRIESVPDSGDYDTLTDPTIVTFTVRRRTPAGVLEAATSYVLADPDVTKVSDGIFEFEHSPSAGRWYVHAQGEGAAHGSERVTYEIDESEALAA